MIGVYNYTVILTYLSLISSLVGIFLTINGEIEFALVCLAFSGLLDMFDGKVARRKKLRTEDEKSFGIQIDSLCDVVCFGAFPIILTYSIGMTSYLSISILCLYGLSGVIRLAHYNVIEAKRQSELTKQKKYYNGLPITSIAIILPISFLIETLLQPSFLIIINLTMLICGILFIVDFKMPKPKNATLGVFISIVALTLLKIFKVF